ncbi:MAG: M67 family metallopeptidase [Rhodospirillales bacterium]|nr:M67 family metallopeptidase [Rhodospirillales bacterium]
MTVEAIVFSEGHIGFIQKCAEKAYPAEACGLITGTLSAGRQLVVHQVRAAKNILAAERHDRFEIDPATRIQVEKDCRRSGLRLVAHFHSHPDQPANPSKTDLLQAYEPDLIWVIAGLEDGIVSAIKAHRLQKDGNAFFGIDLIINKA